MDFEKVEVQCEQCKKTFDIPIIEYEQTMESRNPILCPECYDKLLNTEKLSSPCFEYKIIPVNEISFNFLGQDGWELIIVNNNQGYFKKGV